MKIIVLFLVVFSSLVFPQSESHISIDEKTQKDMLIGLCERTSFEHDSFSHWFTKEYDEYIVSKEELDSLKELISEFDIKIVMGTWCSDSRREVPRFYKVLDTLGYPEKKIVIIAVDRTKIDKDGATETLNIELVPTFIISLYGDEVGRIIESPEESLEKDLKAIITL